MVERPALTLNLLDPLLFPAEDRAPLSAWRSDQHHALDQIVQQSPGTKRQRGPRSTGYFSEDLDWELALR
jgi:hypothetical protein